MNLNRREVLRVFIYFAAAAALTGYYLYRGSRLIGFGFPLDDAWIHQTYARNLAETGRWFFQQGRASAGSTAPLWTLLLVPGYLLRFPPVFWSAGLGALFLAAAAWSASKWMQQRGHSEGLIWAVGAAVLLEWHLQWAAVSGMETIAAAFWVLMFFLLLDRPGFPPFVIGLWVGLGVWIRPDLITLLLPLFLAVAARTKWNPGTVFTYFLPVAAGLLIFVVPYLGMNHLLSGEFWPTTFYAKQAEYASLKQIPFYNRLLQQLVQPIIGAGGVLLPGVLISVYRSLRSRKWSDMAPILWILAYLAMFAVRLPVVYQHGRYAIPTAAVVIVLGGEGMLCTIEWNAKSLLKRVFSRSWAVAVLSVLVVFSGIGAGAYASDVAIIETEMVAVAAWISDNTDPDDIIAVHDIGAMGYFSDRQLLDLAGLISPEVIPFMRDEDALDQYLSDMDVAYLASFPGWYPQLAASGDLVFQTDAVYSVEAGGENMAVYRWGTGQFAQ